VETVKRASLSSKIDPFVHLHVHTDRSLLDGHSTIVGNAQRAAELRQPALSMTDHGSLGGARAHWKACNDAGIKPIIGCEFYIAPLSRTTKEAVYWGRPEQRADDVGGQGAYCHITVLATSDEGVRNLFRLHATSYADGFYRKPRIDLDCLAAHRSGLLVTTGCAGGLVPTRIRLGQHDESSKVLDTLHSIFGEDLYIEIMEHNNPIDVAINPHLISLSKRHSIPLVATNDSHYTLESDAYAHDALLCLQTGQKVNGIRTFKFEGTGYHLRSAEEMVAAFDGDESPIRRTLEIAERVEDYSEVFSSVLRMPKADLSSSFFAESADEELWNMVDAHAPQQKYELETIFNLGFSDYFLVLADIIGWAKSQGIRVGPGRGSAGGSAVARDLGITDLDPQEHGLIFERFLNPQRKQWPDIDVDFQDNRRDEVVAYAIAKYGEEAVAQLGTVGTIGSKSALHDAARVLGYARRISDGLTYRLPPPKFGRQPKLSEGDWSALSDDENKILRLAEELEGRVRNLGVHPAGVVISPEPLKEIIPLYRPGGKGNWVTAYDMNEVEATGLVKYDFLGLKNLDVIDRCVQLLDSGKSYFEEEAPRQVMSTKLSDLSDPGTYELLASGDTIGVFQLDSPGMQQLLRSLKPTEFSDISAVLALYRPGPMAVNAHHSYAKRKNGRERVSYPHSELESNSVVREVLKDTYGLIVYQEQVLELLRICCGYDYASADLIFNAMRKKDTKKMLEAKPDFVQRMSDNGYSDDCVDALWNTLLPFSDYSFNRAHSTGYGTISYWTAYLKKHNPITYMASVLSRETDPKTLPEYIREVARMGIPILSPDINQSDGEWTPTEWGIRYGLSSIKGVGEKAYAAVTAKRPYNSLDDFFKRAPAKSLNGRVVDALVRSGALDSICPNREELFLNYGNLTERALADRKLARQGQRPLYSLLYDVPAAGPFNRDLRQRWETELLGTTITQTQLVLKPTKWLKENEFYYLRSLTEQYPGSQHLQLQLGFAAISVGYVTMSQKFVKQVENLGIDIVEL
jgi:DNA polymerase-3 subunit alpha